MAKPGSDRLVDGVAYGSVDSIAARLSEHLDAGPDKLVRALAKLAGPLGLRGKG
ncbi:hypothetical protein ACTWP6_14810 [Mycobacterium sp. 4D054]|uniref:hypothetical protein n=1 Tax=Mycobacterium sp. 4D054 TaxID=3457440 RepID=UPI003FD3ABB2